MSLLQFQDTTYLEYKTKWFVWEPAWESFRPVTSVSWTGTSYRVEESEYCSDPTDEMYGYGSPQMKQVCDALTGMFASQISKARRVSTPAIGRCEWLFDRRIALSPCCPRTKESWKRAIRGHNRTLRKAPADKFTRRKRE